MRIVRSGFRSFIAIALVLATVIASFGVPVYAQEDPSALKLTTSPEPINLVGNPGETISTELKVKNSGETAQDLNIELLKFAPAGEEGKPQLLERQSGDDYFDWVSFSESQFTIEPDTWQSITMTIDLPPEAAFGYYYAVTFTQPNLESEDIAEGNTLQGGTAILVLVEALNDDAIRNLQPEAFTASRGIYEFLPAEFTVKLANTGNVHLVATGNIFIKKGSEVIATLDVNSGGGNILPDSKRVFTADWTDGFPVYEETTQDGVTSRRLNWDTSNIKNLRMGKYTATLVMSYDDGVRDIPIEAEISFWVIPWRIIFAVLIPLIGIVGLAVAYIRLRRRNGKVKYTNPQEE